jgi:putative lipoic acid-binding regulatory protein
MREIEPHTAPPLIEFPCHFAIKVMGETHETFSATIVEVIQTLVPAFTAEHVEMRASSGGKYISVTGNVYVSSQDQLDGVYRLLSAHPLVKFAL